MNTPCYAAQTDPDQVFGGQSYGDAPKNLHLFKYLLASGTDSKPQFFKHRLSQNNQSKVLKLKIRLYVK